MLIQNTGSTASIPGLTGNSAPIAAGAPASPSQQPASQAQAKPTDAQLKSAVDTINNAMKQAGTNVEFSIDKSTKQTVIKVVESGTGQVITQFPSQGMLAISQMIESEQQHGLLIQQSA